MITWSMLFFSALRHDYVSMPVSGRGAVPPVMLSAYFNNLKESSVDHNAASKSDGSSSSFCQPGLSSLNSPPGQSSSSVATHGYTSPKLSRLQQQVTQFKLLKRAQSQGTHGSSSF